MPDDPIKIIVVDDDPDLRDLLIGYLAREGYEVTGAQNGRALDAALEQCGCDLILLDLMLPGEDGLSIARRLRQASQIPIIMLSARGEDVDRIVGLEVGADDYVSKPFNPRELLARIRAVLRRRSLGRHSPRTRGRSRMTRTASTSAPIIWTCAPMSCSRRASRCP
jgi:two-component system phosphate regulon response regulator OmpR